MPKKSATAACPLNCGFEAEDIAGSMDEHVADDCPKRIVTCQFCGDEFVSESELEHANMCLFGEVECRCGETIIRKDHDEHLLETCPWKPPPKEEPSEDDEEDDAESVKDDEKQEAKAKSESEDSEPDSPDDDSDKSDDEKSEKSESESSVPADSSDTSDDSDKDEEEKPAAVPVVVKEPTPPPAKECPFNCNRTFTDDVDLEVHVAECPRRGSKCVHCLQQIEHPMTAEDHANQCQKAPHLCPNNCGVTVLRDELVDHLNSCLSLEAGGGSDGMSFDVGTVLERMRDDHARAGTDKAVLRQCIIKFQAILDEMRAKVKDNRVKLDKQRDRVFEAYRKVTVLRDMYQPQLNWRIDDWSNKFQAAKEGAKATLHSPVFKTSKYGYKMIVSICPFGNGEASGEYASIFVCIMKGEFDELQTWPFQQTIVFTLVDQSEGKTMGDLSYTMQPNICQENDAFLKQPTSKRNPSFGVTRWVPLGTFNNNEYVRDDTVFIQIAVTVPMYDFC